MLLREQSGKRQTASGKRQGVTARIASLTRRVAHASLQGSSLTGYLRSSPERVGLPVILLLAFALRIYRLGSKNIWWDEGLAIWAVRQGWREVTLWTAQDVHPPLYFWHLWAWVRLVGDSELAARLLSALWGTLTVALTYALGRRLGGRRVGLLGALFLAVARFHIWWSQEMRMYILATLAATFTLYCAVRWFDNGARRPRLWLMGYVLGALACMYTIYIAALAPLVANVYALVTLARVRRERRSRSLFLWLAAQALALLLLVPWLLLALPRMHNWSVAQPYTLRLLITLYATLLALGISTDVERYLLLILPFALVLLGGLATLVWPQRRREVSVPAGRAALLLGSAVASVPLVVYILTRPRSFFYTPRVEARYLVLFAPAFCLLVAWSLVRLTQRVRAVGLAGLACCLGIMVAFLPGYYADRYLRDEMQTFCYILGAYAQPGDVVLLISGNRYPVFGYYYERLVPAARRVPVLMLPKASVLTAENVEEELQTATAGRERFWVAAVEAGLQDPQELALAWLDARHDRAIDYALGYNTLVLYDRSEEPLLASAQDLQPQHRLGWRYPGIYILGYDLPANEVAPGEIVHAGLYYQADASWQVEVEWWQGERRLQRQSATWTETGSKAARASLRWSVRPWYGGGSTCFLLRLTSAAGEVHELRLPGPHIRGIPQPPLAQQITQPLDIALAGGIRLLGYDLHRPQQGESYSARAGETLVLDLYWQAEQPVAEDYTVFTHLVGSTHNPKTGGPVWGQHDGPPVDGTYPTSSWEQGELLRDRHLLLLDPDAPPGDYELEIGLYLPGTGERLRRTDTGEGRILLGYVRVR